MLNFHMLPGYLYVDIVATPQPHSEPHLFSSCPILLLTQPVNNSTVIPHTLKHGLLLPPCPINHYSLPILSVQVLLEGPLFCVRFPCQLMTTPWSCFIEKELSQSHTVGKCQTWGLNSGVCVTKFSGFVNQAQLKALHFLSPLSHRVSHCSALRYSVSSLVGQFTVLQTFRKGESSFGGTTRQGH